MQQVCLNEYAALDVSTRVRKMLGGVDSKRLIWDSRRDLQRLKLIVMTVYVTLFGTFEKQVLVGRAAVRIAKNASFIVSRLRYVFLFFP